MGVVSSECRNPSCKLRTLIETAEASSTTVHG